MKLAGWVSQIQENFVTITDSYKNYKFTLPSDGLSDDQKRKLLPWNYICVSFESDSGNIDNITLDNDVTIELISSNESAIDPHTLNGEDALKYAYLKSRTSGKNIVLAQKDQLIKKSMSFFWDRNFQFIETPVLTRTISEYTKDEFTVTAQLLKGAKYSLSQSPQLFKQLLIAGGVKKYFQLCRNFRSEMGSPNHFQEFTQFDIELVCEDNRALIELMEDYLCTMFEYLLHIELPRPFPRFSYNHIINMYGNDCPDLLQDKSLSQRYPYYFEIGFFPYFIEDFPLISGYKNDKPVPVRHLMAKPKNINVVIEKEIDLRSIHTSGYDLVLNGIELGGGDMRINNYEEQIHIFKLLELDLNEVTQVYSTLLNAQKSAYPAHGGFAIGLDRVAKTIFGVTDIMEVVAFPKTHDCRCLLTDSPN